MAFGAGLGMVLGAAYMLWLYKRVIFSNMVHRDVKQLKDMNKLESSIMLVLASITLLLGIYPNILHHMLAPWVSYTVKIMSP